MLKFYQKMQYAKSVHTVVRVPDLVIIKYFWNKTRETKQISSSVFYSLQLTSARSCNYSCTSS